VRERDEFAAKIPRLLTRNKSRAAATNPRFFYTTLIRSDQKLWMWAFAELSPARLSASGLGSGKGPLHRLPRGDEPYLSLEMPVEILVMEIPP
jgi:hypothetical protein